jgi:hypothetical protein
MACGDGHSRMSFRVHPSDENESSSRSAKYFVACVITFFVFTRHYCITLHKQTTVPFSIAVRSNRQRTEQ